MERKIEVSLLKNFNLPILLLAMLVVLMFCLVGVAFFYESVLFSILFTLLGCAFMGYGLVLKRKRKSDN